MINEKRKNEYDLLHSIQEQRLTTTGTLTSQTVTAMLNSQPAGGTIRHFRYLNIRREKNFTSTVRSIYIYTYTKRGKT